jgi:hypothetical protein
MTNFCKYLSLFLTIIIAGLTITVLLMNKEIRDCRKVPGSDTTIVYLPSDTIFKVIIKQISKPDTIWISKPTHVDTASILEDYYLIKVYIDTLSDGTIQSVIRDSITMNELVGREFKYRILKEKETIITNTIIKSNTGLFLGANIGRSKNEFGFGPSISYVTKKPMLIGINYDLLNKDMYLTAQWRLFGKY